AIRISLNRMVLFALIAIALLVGLGFWTNHAVSESLFEIYQSYLQTILDADVTALRIWVEDEKEFVKLWADEPQLRASVRGLLQIGTQSSGRREQLIASQFLSDLQDQLTSVLKDKDYQGFGVLDRTGLVLAAGNQDAYVGQRLAPALMPLLADVFQDQVVIERPHLKGNVLVSVEPRRNQPIMMTAAPIRDGDDQIVAALVFLINPDQDFTRILSVARPGKTGDTYAFDKDGFLISNSRFEDQLKVIGLLDDHPDARSILSTQIRDPGGDLTRGFQPETPVTARPLTRMAAAAVGGDAGMDLQGYRDYRGVEVYGAWQWLPEYGFGVATEMSKSEALAVLRPLTRAFQGLFLLLLASSGVILLTSLSIRRLKYRIDEIKQLGQYTLEEKIGEGGMGTVYRARHAVLKRPTAVKLLKPEAVNPETVARFEREVQLTSQLTHPNTIEVYDYGRTPEGIFYYAMEYLPGVNLGQLIDMEGAIAPARAIHILKHVCFSLEEAHGKGLIHRDIKPLNIILCERGGQFDAVKVLDFGLVKDIGRHDIQHTAVHALTGTPAYVAPERLTDPQNIDARSDIYCLGAVGFNLLTGRDVFEGTNAMEICYHVMQTPPPRPSERLDAPIPHQLDQLILDCLAKDPADRPPDVRAIIDALVSIPDAGRWNQDDARRWWEKNAHRLSIFR
ncbi:MAG: protein kinase, partial [Desulfobacterales bacterium]